MAVHISKNRVLSYVVFNRHTLLLGFISLIFCQGEHSPSPPQLFEEPWGWSKVLYLKKKIYACIQLPIDSQPASTFIQCSFLGINHPTSGAPLCGVVWVEDHDFSFIAHDLIYHPPIVLSYIPIVPLRLPKHSLLFQILESMDIVCKYFR